MNREIKQKQKSNLWRPSCFLHMGNHRPCTGCSDVPKTCQKNSDVPKTCQNFCQKPVKIFIFALFFSKYSFSSLNMYSFWPQDKRNKEDDVGDEDEDVPEGQPSPHRLGPETESLKQKVQKRKFKTESQLSNCNAPKIPKHSLLRCHSVCVVGLFAKTQMEKSWRSNSIRAEVIACSSNSSDTILVSLFCIEGHVRPRLKKTIVCKNPLKCRDKKF